ncbi:hypothetical protein QJS04_geneDACA021936 [Acorus gramineus]|uniref:Uncharacterized protein n=1 Tax=Acorus gramineus TaxID=55184 RepID=A0AAV9A455_ACOGR|nr:hypothetical protein QJS04_geneDACA021936 [Acorus gramineus]
MDTFCLLKLCKSRMEGKRNIPKERDRANRNFYCFNKIMNVPLQVRFPDLFQLVSNRTGRVKEFWTVEELRQWDIRFAASCSPPKESATWN